MISTTEGYDLLDRFLRRCQLEAGSRLLRAAVPFSHAELGRIQHELRSDAHNWDAEFKRVLDLGRPRRRSDKEPTGETYRSEMVRRGDQIARMTGRATDELDWTDRCFWIAAQCLCFAEQFLSGLEEIVEGTTRNRLEGHVERSVVKIAKYTGGVGDDAVNVVREVTDRVRSQLANVSKLSQAPIAELSRNIEGALSKPGKAEDIAADVVAPLLLSPERTANIISTEPAIARAWAYTKVVAAIAKRLGYSVLCDFYLPAASQLVVVASSGQEHPGPAPRIFAHRWVAPNTFQGGACVGSRSFLPNYDPREETNSNNQQEGSPRVTFAIPVIVKHESPAQVGQLFVAIRGRKVAPSDQLLLLGLVAADCLTRDLSGLPGFHWQNYFNPVLDRPSLCDRLVQVVERDFKNSMNLRTGFVVVSASNCFAGDHEATQSVDALLDNWARFAALRMANGLQVYQVEPRSYAFVIEDMDRRAWVAVRDKTVFGWNDVLPVSCPNGDKAGSLAAWTVMWRHDVLTAAKVSLPGRVPNLIERQIETAAAAIEALNTLQAQYSSGEYRTAYAAAKKLVEDYGSDCGVIVNELVRLSLLKEDFASALEDSIDRRALAPWDPEAHANLLWSWIATGDLGSAIEEITNCDTCWSHDPTNREARRTAEFPMLGLAVAFLCTFRGPSSIRMQFDDRRQLDSCLNVLAPNLINVRKQVRAALADVRKYLINASGVSPESTLSKLLLDLDQLSREDHWGEVTALSRVVISVRGLLRAIEAQAIAQVVKSQASILIARISASAVAQPSIEDSSATN